MNETIVAVASPTSAASRGIVRLTGDDAMIVLERMGFDPVAGQYAKRLSAEIDLGDPLGRVPVDLLVWPNRRSYTGQPSAELHTYGCLPILQRLVDRTLQAGARAARPGEFTMRAFLAGRLDLTQAEAVLGVIDAENRGALDSALRQLAGNLSRPLERLRGDMLDLLADVEAGLDFVDEDIQFVSDETLVQRLGEIAGQIDSVRTKLVARRQASSMTVVAFRGEPNAGKSRLINTLSQSDAAIVADRAGTTRDTVSVDIEYRGHTIRLVDTAGIESDDHAISRAAQAQAEQAMQDADIRVWCIDATSNDFECKRDELRTLAERAKTHRVDLWVATKSDMLAAGVESRLTSFEFADPSDRFQNSSISGEGIDSLRERIFAAVLSRLGEETGSVLGTAARCSGSLLGASQSLHQAIELATTAAGHELVAGELRLAVENIGEVTGAVYTDDLLDRVFSRFCIGK